MKIVVAEKMSASAVNLLREPGWNVITPDQLNGSLAQELETADALLVRSAVQVDAALLAKAGKLRVVGGCYDLETGRVGKFAAGVLCRVEREGQFRGEPGCWSG